MRIYSSSALVVSYDIVVPGMRTIKAMKLWQSPENLFLRERREEREKQRETERNRERERERETDRNSERERERNREKQRQRDATNKTKRKEEWSWFVRGLIYSNHSAFTFSKLTIETLEQGVKYFQS